MIDWHINTVRQNEHRRGFTVIELLIVIVVIAILATITIIAYNAIKSEAVDKSLQADLRGAASQLELDRNKGGLYPATAAAANNGAGLKSTAGTTLTYTQLGPDYCLSATAPTATTSYYISSKSNKAVAGNCTRVASTFAGSGTYGALNGPAATAQFSGPYDVAIAKDGTQYITECYGNRVRQISPAGDVSTLAGSGTAGAANNTGVLASFSCPDGIAINSAGEIFVADVYNGLIRKITTAGAVTTFIAVPSGLTDITFDKSGNLIVAGGHLVRKITPGGVISTIAGATTSGFNNATGTAARFNMTNGVTLDGAGNIYVADGFNARIRMITPSGVVSTVAGSATSGTADGTGAAAQFNVPFGIASTSDGTLFVTDGNNNRIRIITAGGVVTTLSGTASGTGGFADGPVSTARFHQPRGIALDYERNLYIADIDTQRVRKITLP